MLDSYILLYISLKYLSNVLRISWKYLYLLTVFTTEGGCFFSRWSEGRPPVVASPRTVGNYKSSFIVRCGSFLTVTIFSVWNSSRCLIDFYLVLFRVSDWLCSFTLVVYSLVCLADSWFCIRRVPRLCVLILSSYFMYLRTLFCGGTMYSLFLAFLWNTWGF